ncbi:MAG: hypothetical protein KAS32_31390 [Candidatus Peribacteraceae bacterium]|nr:hypothetical protein [Candidatus Peribacteraceae bacterium]
MTGLNRSGKIVVGTALLLTCIWGWALISHIYTGSWVIEPAMRTFQLGGLYSLWIILYELMGGIEWVEQG